MEDLLLTSLVSLTLTPLELAPLLDTSLAAKVEEGDAPLAWASVAAAVAGCGRSCASGAGVKA